MAQILAVCYCPYRKNNDRDQKERGMFEELFIRVRRYFRIQRQLQQKAPRREKWVSVFHGGVKSVSLLPCRSCGSTVESDGTHWRCVGCGRSIGTGLPLED